MPNPKKKYTIEEARAFAKKNPEAFNKALDKINPDPYRGTRKFAELLINQYPDRFKGLKPENFLSMLDSIAKAESPQGNVIQRSYNKKTKKYYNGPARGYYQIETTSAPTFSNRYKAYQDILKPLSAVPLPDIKVPKSGDVRSLSRDEQARLALANMSTVAAVKKEKLNPLDSQNSWLNFHWNGSPADKPARQQHWRETFGYGDGGQTEPTRADSLALLNNTNMLNKYYSDQKYRKGQVEFDDIPPDYIESSNLDWFNDSGSTIKDNAGRTGLRATPQGIRKVSQDEYYRNIDKNKFLIREGANSVLDTNAPPALFDRRINSTSRVQYENITKNHPLEGDQVDLYGYDPLSITPWDMLTPEQQKQRVAQFGNNGTPYTNKKSGIKINEDKDYHRLKPPVSKMDTINKKIPVDYNQQISTDSPVIVPQFHPYAGYNNPNIPKGYYELGQGKKIETFKEGGEIYYSDPNKFIEAQQAYNDSTNYYNFMHSERRKIPHGADPKAWMNSKEANDLLIEESNLQGAVMDRNTRAGVKLGKLPYPTLPVSKPVFRPTHANGGVIDTNTYGKQDVNRSLMQSGGRIKWTLI